MSRYKTNQRALIFSYLQENRHRHMTADDVLFHLKSNGCSVGKATVYRYFDALLEEGYLRKFDGANGKSACYQFVENNLGCCNHYHLMCDSCNQLFHIECQLLDNVNQHILDSHAFQVNNLKTTFHGLCEQCSAKH